MLLALASILIHGLGHSSAVSRYGGSPGPIGSGLYAHYLLFTRMCLKSGDFAAGSAWWWIAPGLLSATSLCIFALLSYITGAAEFIVACALY
jgi:hypothetical protein